MARVERHSAQGEIPVPQAVLAGDFAPDTSSAEALRAVGETVEGFAKRLKEEQDVRKELAKRKRDAQDRIGITNVNAIMDDAIREYQKQIIRKPLTEHAIIRQKVLANARARANQENLTPEAREIAENNFNIKAEKFSDTAELANIQATNNDALIRTSEAYETALIEGDIDDIDDAERLLDAQLKNLPSAEAAKFKVDLEERATKEIEDKAISDARDKAVDSPELTKRLVKSELKLRKDGKKGFAQFALLSKVDLESLRDYADSIGTSNKNKVQTQYDVATGEAAKGWNDLIVTGELTEQIVRETPIEVSPEKEVDVAALRNTWATIARGIETRKRTQQEGKDKKAREDAYNPKLAADLKTEARNAKGEKQIMDVNERAAKALVQNFIDDADMEAISFNASKSFDTVVDKTIDSHDSGLKAIMLKGTSTVSLPAWLQAQALAFTTTGRTMTATDIQDLIKTFGDVGKAREWGADEARREVEAEIEKTDKKETVNDVRLLYLAAQKRWLAKNDTELVDEYNEWLTSKP